MSVLAATMIAGTAVSIFGQYKANQDQAQLEYLNSQWLETQADYYELATAREMELYIDESNEVIGQQVGQIAGGGIDITTGSALDIPEISRFKQQKEISAIKLKGQMAVNEARLKAGMAQSKGDMLSSFEYNFMQGLGTGLNGAASYFSAADTTPRQSPGAQSTGGRSAGGRTTRGLE